MRIKKPKKAIDKNFNPAIFLCAKIKIPANKFSKAIIEAP